MTHAFREPMTPISLSDARDGLSRALKAFRSGEQNADPIFFGAHRKPEGVIMSYQHFQALARATMLLEDLGDIALLRDRLASSVSPDTLDDLETVAADLGLTGLGDLDS